jgi:hypothetical protein
LSTFLAVLGCAGTVGLWGVLCWMRDRYGREILAATETIQNQKSTIDAMGQARGMDRNIALAINERDETINGLIARIEGLEKSYQSRCRELDARNCELLAMRNKAREIVSTSFASNSASDSDQPQKPLCDN